MNVYIIINNERGRNQIIKGSKSKDDDLAFARATLLVEKIDRQGGNHGSPV
jgi:hypothetical protein